MQGETVLNPESGETFRADLVTKQTDPVSSPQPYVTPPDFSAQYPTPLDTTEFIAMCEEISLLQAIPERPTGLLEETWREMTSLEFTSGSAYLAFAEGACPEETQHNGSNRTIGLKNLGAKKNLSISQIMHSAAVAGANWNGINRLVGGMPSSEGLPGGMDMATFQRQAVADLKEKEIRLNTTLVMNGWDKLLVDGDSAGNSLEFDGIENWQANQSVSFHTNDNSASGTFSAASFDRFLSESCAKPTHVLGHSTAIQELMSAYFQLGYQGSQLVNFADGNRITPGYNFSAFVNTGIGRLQVVGDNNFARSAAGTTSFQATLWAMRMTHNGEPLVYRPTQIPLSLIDLVPGCTTISFQVWTKTALIIKIACAHGAYTSQFTGRVQSTCTAIG